MAADAYQWIDLIWLPVALISCRRGHRLMGLALVAACVLTLRLQLELLAATIGPRSLLHLFDASPLLRGQITYSIFIGLFLCLAFLSPAAPKMVFFAAALSLYIFAFTASMLVMLV